jgi:hypothetical protein
MDLAMLMYDQGECLGGLGGLAASQGAILPPGTAEACASAWTDIQEIFQKYINIPVGGNAIIKSANGGKCLDVFEESYENGATVGQWTCNWGDNQLWHVDPLGSGYQIQARHSDKCLDVLEDSHENGAAVIQWECHGGSNQTWQLVPTSTAGYYQLQSVSSGKCLDVAEASRSNGAVVHLWDCHDGANQQWAILD